LGGGDRPLRNYLDDGKTVDKAIETWRSEYLKNKYGTDKF